MKKNVTAGIIIILIGIIWLLSNLNIFSFSVVDVLIRSLARLWPLLLIGFGLNILLRDNSVLKTIVWLIILTVIFLYGVFGVTSSPWEYFPPNYNYSESHDYSLTKEDATEEGFFKYNFGAGEVRFSSTDANLMQVQSNVPNLDYDQDFENGHKKVIIDFAKRSTFPFKGDPKFFSSVNLHKDVLWEMDLDLGAAEADLDLRDLLLKKLDLDVGAADLALRLGNKYPQTDVVISAGASNITVYVPKEVGLKIKLNSALSGNNLDGLELEKRGDTYISPDFDQKAVKINLEIEIGVGNLEIHGQ